MKQHAEIICPKLIAKKAKEAKEREAAAALVERKAAIEKIITEEEFAKAEAEKLSELRKLEYWESPKYNAPFKRFVTVSGYVGICNC